MRPPVAADGDAAEEDELVEALARAKRERSDLLDSLSRLRKQEETSGVALQQADAEALRKEILAKRKRADELALELKLSGERLESLRAEEAATRARAAALGPAAARGERGRLRRKLTAAESGLEKRAADARRAEAEAAENEAKLEARSKALAEADAIAAAAAEDAATLARAAREAAGARAAAARTLELARDEATRAADDWAKRLRGLRREAWFLERENANHRRRVEEARRAREERDRVAREGSLASSDAETSSENGDISDGGHGVDGRAHGVGRKSAGSKSKSRGHAGAGAAGVGGVDANASAPLRADGPEAEGDPAAMGIPYALDPTSVRAGNVGMTNGVEGLTPLTGIEGAPGQWVADGALGVGEGTVDAGVVPGGGAAAGYAPAAFGATAMGNGAFARPGVFPTTAVGTDASPNADGQLGPAPGGRRKRRARGHGGSSAPLDLLEGQWSRLASTLGASTPQEAVVRWKELVAKAEAIQQLCEMAEERRRRAERALAAVEGEDDEIEANTLASIYGPGGPLGFGVDGVIHEGDCEGPGAERSLVFSGFRGDDQALGDRADEESDGGYAQGLNLPNGEDEAREHSQGRDRNRSASEGGHEDPGELNVASSSPNRLELAQSAKTRTARTSSMPVSVEHPNAGEEQATGAQQKSSPALRESSSLTENLASEATPQPSAVGSSRVVTPGDGGNASGRRQEAPSGARTAYRESADATETAPEASASAADPPGGVDEEATQPSATGSARLLGSGRLLDKSLSKTTFRSLSRSLSKLALKSMGSAKDRIKSSTQEAAESAAVLDDEKSGDGEEAMRQEPGAQEPNPGTTSDKAESKDAPSGEDPTRRTTSPLAGGQIDDSKAPPQSGPPFHAGTHPRGTPGTHSRPGGSAPGSRSSSPARSTPASKASGGGQGSLTPPAPPSNALGASATINSSANSRRVQPGARTSTVTDAQGAGLDGSKVAALSTSPSAASQLSGASKPATASRKPSASNMTSTPQSRVMLQRGATDQSAATTTTTPEVVTPQASSVAASAADGRASVSRQGAENEGTLTPGSQPSTKNGMSQHASPLVDESDVTRDPSRCSLAEHAASVQHSTPTTAGTSPKLGRSSASATPPQAVGVAIADPGAAPTEGGRLAEPSVSTSVVLTHLEGRISRLDARAERLRRAAAIVGASLEGITWRIKDSLAASGLAPHEDGAALDVPFGSALGSRSFGRLGTFALRMRGPSAAFGIGSDLRWSPKRSASGAASAAPFSAAPGGAVQPEALAADGVAALPLEALDPKAPESLLPALEATQDADAGLPGPSPYPLTDSQGASGRVPALLLRVAPSAGPATQAGAVGAQNALWASSLLAPDTPSSDDGVLLEAAAAAEAFRSAWKTLEEVLALVKGPNYDLKGWRGGKGRRGPRRASDDEGISPIFERDGGASDDGGISDEASSGKPRGIAAPPSTVVAPRKDEGRKTSPCKPLEGGRYLRWRLPSDGSEGGPDEEESEDEEDGRRRDRRIGTRPEALHRNGRTNDGGRPLHPGRSPLAEGRLRTAGGSASPLDVALLGTGATPRLVRDDSEMSGATSIPQTPASPSRRATYAGPEWTLEGPSGARGPHVVPRHAPSKLVADIAAGATTGGAAARAVAPGGAAVGTSGQGGDNSSDPKNRTAAALGRALLYARGEEPDETEWIADRAYVKRRAAKIVAAAASAAAQVAQTGGSPLTGLTGATKRALK